MHTRPIALLLKPDKKDTLDISKVGNCELLDFLEWGGVNIRLQAANLEEANWRTCVPELSSPDCGRYKCYSCFSCSSRFASDGHGASCAASCLRSKADCEPDRPQVENTQGPNVRKRESSSILAYNVLICCFEIIFR